MGERQRSDGDDVAAGRCQCFAEEFVGKDGGGGGRGCEQAEFARGGSEGFGFLGEPASRGWGLSGACISVIERRSLQWRRAVLFGILTPCQCSEARAQSHWPHVPLLCTWP